MGYKVRDMQFEDRFFQGGNIFSSKEEVVSALTAYHGIDFTGVDKDDNELEIEDYFDYYNLDTEEQLDFLLDHGEWELIELTPKRYRFFTTSLPVNDNYFDDNHKKIILISDNIKSAIGKFIDYINDSYAYQISQNASKFRNMSYIYNDSPSGTKLAGIIIKASFETANNNNKWVRVYTNLWVSIEIVFSAHEELKTLGLER